ncbi:GDP-mannose 4,6-dehydratase [bacterium]|nr:GDP-mannose 4,6-dehydratase [bacterium]NUN46159.1 GDP-mannose 4,6-dehydratase [bacterium]
MSKILVTGCAGFIGSHVTDALLKAGHEVVGLDNFDHFYDPAIKEKNLTNAIQSPGFRLLRGDILDADLMSRIFSESKLDLVIHLAARAGVRPSIQDPKIYQKVNVEGTMNILEAMRAHNVKKLLLASSSSVYGNNEKVPYHETDNVDHAISPYAATKKACEVLAYTYHHLFGIDAFCLRFFTVYGPRQRPEMAIHLFTRLIDEGKPITLFGDGQTFRDYTYVDDIVHGIMQCIDGLRGYEILNLGESQTISLIDLVNTIEKALGKKAQIRWMPNQPGDVQKTYADISKAKRLIGYKPSVSINIGIERFVDYFRST